MKRLLIYILACAIGIIPLSYSTVAAAECISDVRIQQLKFRAHLNAHEIEELIEFANKGELERGWHLLGSLGDHYAAIAGNVISNDPTISGSFYKRLIANHWISANGVQKYRHNFQLVAKQHFRQYVSILQATGNWPDSDQILNSYLKAVRDHGLRDITVFDAAWDAAGMSKFRSWQSLNHLEQERTIFPTRACFNINRYEAKRIIRSDLFRAPF
ncbi:MAG: hypothetical protein ACXVCY_10995 [Pseudobdellovibrionaceae bacterium]